MLRGGGSLRASVFFKSCPPMITMRGQRCDMVSGYLKLCSQKDVPPGLKCWSSPGKRCRHLQHQREDGAIQRPDGAAVSADLCPPARGSFSALVTQWAGVTRPSALGKGEKVVLREHACMNTEDAGDRSAVSQAAQSSALPPRRPSRSPADRPQAGGEGAGPLLPPPLQLQGNRRQGHVGSSSLAA